MMIKAVVLAFILSVLCAHCGKADDQTPEGRARRRMVRDQIAGRGIKDPKVLSVMEQVPRHLFVSDDVRSQAYEDHPLSIGYGQTISQPYIVAYMTEMAQLQSQDKVLEIGTGSGYQAAVLAEIVRAVYSIEIVEPLADQAQALLEDLNYDNVFIKKGDGYQGWEENAPYDAILVTAAPPEIPQTLLEQLEIGGRMIVPVGNFSQALYAITRTEEGFHREDLIPVRFVPMVHDTP